MSQGWRLVPAARLALLLLPTFLALCPARGLGGAPPLSDDRLYTRKARLLLLTRGDICGDLGLDANQAAEARRALDALYEQAAALRGQRGQAALERRRAIDEAEEEWLRTHLSEAQRKRLIEIDLQWEGPSALISRPVVADHLGLTRDQRVRLTEAIASRNRRRTQGIELHACERALNLEAQKLLTPEQSLRWKAMLGPPCTFQVSAQPAPTTR